MTPSFFSNVAHSSPKRLISASLLLCPGLAMAAAFTPMAEGLALEDLLGANGDRWCLLYRTQGVSRILNGTACDRPQSGLIRQFD